MQVKTNDNVYIRLMSKLKHGFNTKWEVHLFVLKEKFLQFFMHGYIMKLLF